MMKYVFVTGGVVSSLGKGTTAASLGRLLKARGYKVAMQKCDTYYNFNPALLSPLQHGENFITEDGVAADLDLGHYERFIDESLKGEASITTGKIHTALVERELRGEYHGATITVVPHVTNEIKHRIITAAENSGAGYCDYRDRRRGGRYRVLTVSGGDSPAEMGAGRGQHMLHPCGADAVFGPLRAK